MGETHLLFVAQLAQRLPYNHAHQLVTKIRERRLARKNSGRRPMRQIISVDWQELSSVSDDEINQLSILDNETHTQLITTTENLSNNSSDNLNMRRMKRRRITSHDAELPKRTEATAGECSL